MDTTGHTWIDSTGVISISSGERVSLGSTVHLPAKTMLGEGDTSSQYEQASYHALGINIKKELTELNGGLQYNGMIPLIM